jgi:hypothetical protein
MSDTDKINVKSLLPLLATVVMLCITLHDAYGDLSHLQRPTEGLVKHSSNNSVQRLGGISEIVEKTGQSYLKAYTSVSELADMASMKTGHLISENNDQNSQQQQSVSDLVPNTATTSNNRLRYENSSLGIQMQYPTDWYKIASDDSVKFLFKQRVFLAAPIALAIWSYPAAISVTNGPKT